VQYVGAVEPQRRLAPHAHFAIRGTITRDLIRKVAAATYHQVWWPLTRSCQPSLDTPPRYDEQARCWVHPDTSEPLPTWQAALDAIDVDPEAVPVHVVRFGNQVHAQASADRRMRNSACVHHQVPDQTRRRLPRQPPRQRAHLDRLWDELR
jgi:hypothetical protein